MVFRAARSASSAIAGQGVGFSSGFLVTLLLARGLDVESLSSYFALQSFIGIGAALATLGAEQRAPALAVERGDDPVGSLLLTAVFGGALLATVSVPVFLPVGFDFAVLAAGLALVGTVSRVSGSALRSHEHMFWGSLQGEALRRIGYSGALLALMLTSTSGLAWVLLGGLIAESLGLAAHIARSPHALQLNRLSRAEVEESTRHLMLGSARMVLTTAGPFGLWLVGADEAAVAGLGMGLRFMSLLGQINTGLGRYAAPRLARVAVLGDSTGLMFATGLRRMALASAAATVLGALGIWMWRETLIGLLFSESGLRLVTDGILRPLLIAQVFLTLSSFAYLFCVYAPEARRASLRIALVTMLGFCASTPFLAHARGADGVSEAVLFWVIVYSVGFAAISRTLIGVPLDGWPVGVHAHSGRGATYAK